MPVSRKNRNVKKSSKRSKNVRTSKKTRKHMRSMRGGGTRLDPGINQTIDFIIKCGDEILVRKNPEVTGNNDVFALIGTFASASLYNKAPNTITDNIKNGIIKANEEIKKGETLDIAKTTLVNLAYLKNNDVVKGLLIKKLLQQNDSSENKTNSNKNNMKSKAGDLINSLTNIKITPVTTDFYEIKDDVRLNQTCKILTQLFTLNITQDVYDLYLKDRFQLIKNLDDLFIGHKKLLEEPEIKGILNLDKSLLM
jgi:hypothetical protein